MRQASAWTLAALVLAAWLAPGPTPEHHRPSASAAVQAAAPEPAPALVATPHPIDWSGRPPSVACVRGLCTELSVVGGPPPPPLAQPGARSWNANLTLDGPTQPGGLAPMLTLQAGPHGGGNATARCADNCTAAYRDVATAGGSFPVRLVVQGIELREGETELRLLVWGAPPPGQVGILSAPEWHLEGTLEALSPTPSH